MRKGVTIKSRRLALAVLAVCTFAGSRAAVAITIRSDVSDSLYTALSAQSQYSSVGFIDVFDTNETLFGSGILVAPDWVLTAGHVVSHDETGAPIAASQVSFGMGASTTPFTVAPDSVSQVDVDPAFTSSGGNSIQGNDLALVQLSSPITNTTPAILYNSAMGSELGLTATVVGYGLTGTGTTGDVKSSGTRRAMQNVIDAFGGQSVPGASLAAYSPNILFTDFDSPTNPLLNVMGSSTPLTLEGAVAPGDSGGGVFITVNGTTYLDAVVDFAANAHTNPTGKYGDYDGYTRLDVSNSTNFLNSILVTNSTWNLSGGGTWANQASWSGAEIPEWAGATANFSGAIAAPSTVTLDDNWTAGTVTFNNTNSYTLTASAGASTGSLVLDNGGLSATASVIDNNGSHTIAAPIVLNSSAVFNVVNAGNVLSISGPFTGAGGVTIAGSGIVRLTPGSGTVALSALAVQSGATLDITSNTVAINYGAPGNSPIAAIKAALVSGYNNGQWTGTGITSSLATSGVPQLGASPIFSIGYADGNIDSNTAAAANQVLIKFTLAGDANLDGQVDFNDAFIVGKHMNTTGNDWADGNFTYDPAGGVNFNDLFLLGQNINTSLQSTAMDQMNSSPGSLQITSLSAVQDTIVAVPEPGLSALAMAGLCMLMRRRRKA